MPVNDVLTLGGIQFTDFSPPDSMGAGGRQAMVVHKLPGGQRVIDTLGPDEAPIAWRGTFFGNDALGIALALDGMRAAGAVVPLFFAGQARAVLIESFSWTVRRLAIWVDYTISCTVVQNPQQGNLSVNNASAGDLAANDLNAAGNVAGLPNQTPIPDGSVPLPTPRPSFLSPGSPG